MAEDYLRRSLRRPVDADLPTVDSGVTKRTGETDTLRAIAAQQGAFKRGLVQNEWQGKAADEFIKAGKRRAAGEEGWEKNRDKGRSLRDKGQVFDIQQSDVRNIRGVGDAVKFAAFHTGSEAKAFGSSVTGGALTAAGGALSATGIGAPVGAAVSGLGLGILGAQTADDYRKSMGEALGSQFDDAGSADADPTKALWAARGKAAFDAAGNLIPGRIGGRAAREAVDAVTGTGTKAVSSKLKNVGKDMALEAGQEVTSELVGHGLDKALANKQADLDPWDLVNAAAAGAAVGGTFSGGAALASSALEKSVNTVGEKLNERGKGAKEGKSGGEPPKDPRGPFDKLKDKFAKGEPQDLGPDKGGIRGRVNDTIDAVKDKFGGPTSNVDESTTGAKERTNSMFEGATGVYDAGVEIARSAAESVAARWSDLSTGFKDVFAKKDVPADATEKTAKESKRGAKQEAQSVKPDSTEETVAAFSTARDQLSEAIHSAQTELSEYLGEKGEAVVSRLTEARKKIEEALSRSPEIAEVTTRAESAKKAEAELPSVMSRVSAVMSNLGNSGITDGVTGRFKKITSNLGKSATEIKEVRAYIDNAEARGLIPIPKAISLLKEVDRLEVLDSQTAESGDSVRLLEDHSAKIEEAKTALIELSEGDYAVIKDLDRAAEQKALDDKNNSVGKWEFKWHGADYTLGDKGSARKSEALGNAIDEMQAADIPTSTILGTIFGGGRVYGDIDALREGLDNPALAGNSPEETAANIQRAVEDNTRNAVNVRNSMLEDASVPTTVKDLLSKLDPSSMTDQKMIADAYDRHYKLQDVMAALAQVERLYGPETDKKMSLVGVESLSPELIDAVAEALGPEHAAAAPDIATRLARAVAFLSDKEMARDLFTADLRNTYVDILAASGSNDSYLAQMFLEAGEPIPARPETRVAISGAIRDAAVSRMTGNRLGDDTPAILSDLRESLGSERLDAAIDYYAAVDQADDALASKHEVINAIVGTTRQSLKNSFNSMLETFDTDGRVRTQLAKFGNIEAIESFLPEDIASTKSASESLQVYKALGGESIPFFVTAANLSIAGINPKDANRIVTELASYIDRTSMSYAYMNDVQKNNAIKPLELAYGSRDKAEAVLAYYGVYQRGVAEFMASSYDGDISLPSNLEDSNLEDSNVVAPEYVGGQEQVSAIDADEAGDAVADTDSVSDEYGGLNEKDVNDYSGMDVSYRTRSDARPFLRSRESDVAEAKELAKSRGGEAIVAKYGDVFRKKLSGVDEESPNAGASTRAAVRRELNRIKRVLKAIREGHAERDRASIQALRDAFGAKDQLTSDEAKFVKSLDAKLRGKSLEDRSAWIKDLDEEIKLLEANAKSAIQEYNRTGNEDALFSALDIYDVVLTPEDGMAATDLELRRFRSSINQQKAGAPAIRVMFNRPSGKPYEAVFSPTAMLKHSKVKGSTRERLSDSLARLAAREDFAGFSDAMKPETDLGFKRDGGKGNYTWGEFITGVGRIKKDAVANEVLSKPKTKTVPDADPETIAAFRAARKDTKAFTESAFSDRKDSVLAEATMWDSGVDALLDGSTQDLEEVFAGVIHTAKRLERSIKTLRSKKELSKADTDHLNSMVAGRKALASVARDITTKLVPEPEWITVDLDSGAGYYDVLSGLVPETGEQTNSYMRIASAETRLDILRERKEFLKDFPTAVYGVENQIRYAQERMDKMVQGMPVWERHHDRASIPQTGKASKDAAVIRDTKGGDVDISREVGIPDIVSKARAFFAKPEKSSSGEPLGNDISVKDITQVVASAPKILSVLRGRGKLSPDNEGLRVKLERLVSEATAGKNTHPKAFVDILNNSKYTRDLSRGQKGEIYKAGIKSIRDTAHLAGVEPRRVIDVGHAHALLNGEILTPGQIVSAAANIPVLIEALSANRDMLTPEESAILERAQNFTQSRKEESLYGSINRLKNLSTEGKKQLWVLSRDAFREASGTAVRDTKLSAAELKERSALIKGLDEEARKITPVEIIKERRQAMEDLALGNPGGEWTLDKLLDTARGLRQYMYNAASDDKSYSPEVRDEIQKMFARGNAKLIEQKLKDIGYPGNKREGSRAIREALGFEIQSRIKDVGASAEERYSRDTSKVEISDAEIESLKGSIAAEIAKLRGGKVSVAFDTLGKIGGAGSFTLNRDTKERLIKIAIDGADPLGAARHESFHDFFDEMGASRETRSFRNRLRKHIVTPAKRRAMADYMRKRGINEEAINQLRDPDEMLAYYFQFWSEDPTFLEGDRPTPDSFVGKAFQAIKAFFAAVRDTANTLIGRKSEDAKLHEVLRLLRDGRVQDVNALDKALMDRKLLGIFDSLNRLTGGIIGYKGSRLIMPAAAYLRDHGSVGVNNILRMFSPDFVDESGDPGFIKTKIMNTSKRLNKLEDILEGASKDELADLGEELVSMKPATSERGKKLRAFLDELFVMQDEAGVMRWDNDAKAWLPIRKVNNYGTRKWDPKQVANDKDGFMETFSKYMSESDARALMNAILHGDGQIELADGPGHLGYTPFHASVNARTLNFITADNVGEFMKYMDTDVVELMTTYTQQAVHRAEYARYFGNDGAKLRENLDIAIGEGLDEGEIASVMNAIHSMQGTLDNPNVSRRWKTFNAVSITAQNVALLGLIVFSSLPDALGVAARTGSLKDAGKTLFHGLNTIYRDIRKLPPTAQERFARRAGIIAADNLVDAMGASSHSMNMSPIIRKLNTKFFALTGIASLTKGMRVAAAGIGMDYIIENKGDKEFMKSLGLKESDVIVDNNGDLVTDPAELVRHWARNTKGEVDEGVFKQRAEELSQRLESALFQFVDSTIVRPNASHRPAWASDPRFQIFAYLKQYTWSFRQVVLGRAKYEMNDRENFTPLLPLLLYAPFMFMSDVARGSIFGTASNFTSSNYILGSLARSGILGVGSFGLDAYNDAQRGGVLNAVAGAAGPVVEHIAMAGDTALGDVSSQRLLDRTMPGGSVIRGLRRKLEDD